MEIRKINDYLWEIPKTGGMRVPGRIYANQEFIDAIKHEDSLKQVANVAHLPGIVKYSIAMANPPRRVPVRREQSCSEQ